MGLIEELRKKFQKESAEDFIIKVNIQMNGNAKAILKEIEKQKRGRKNVKRRL
jgi:hypothetical protein